MAYFSGREDNKIDEKGRVALPSKMRALLHPEAENSVVMIPTADPCIKLLPLDQWREAEAEMVENVDSANKRQRQLRALLMSYAEPQVLDSQGRMRLHPDLMKRVGLSVKGTAAFIGVGKSIEIYHPDNAPSLDDELSLEDAITEFGLGSFM
ncbi:MAG: division/cell wall cluster transcriptional repressor MraZ [Bacteroidota bacterium]